MVIRMTYFVVVGIRPRIHFFFILLFIHPPPSRLLFLIIIVQAFCLILIFSLIIVLSAFSPLGTINGPSVILIRSHHIRRPFCRLGGIVSVGSSLRERIEHLGIFQQPQRSADVSEVLLIGFRLFFVLVLVLIRRLGIQGRVFLPTFLSVEQNLFAGGVPKEHSVRGPFFFPSGRGGRGILGTLLFGEPPPALFRHQQKQRVPHPIFFVEIVQTGIVGFVSGADP
mmetsp:Transcript_33588/g.77482  ORF Transcript_33588/g.77482 Transcript_33588/m.77482 type:complete len:225 (+) Transcript_33588:458-1132(+)